MFNRIWTLILAVIALLTDKYSKIAIAGAVVTAMLYLAFPQFMGGVTLGICVGVVITLLFTPAPKDD
jgi:hypothetical protein